MIRESLLIGKGVSNAAVWLYNTEIQHDVNAMFSDESAERRKASKEGAEQKQRLRPSDLNLGPYPTVGAHLGLLFNQITYYYLVTEPNSERLRLPSNARDPRPTWRQVWDNAAPGNNYGFKPFMKGTTNVRNRLVPQLLRFALYTDLVFVQTAPESVEPQLRSVPTKWGTLLDY